MRQIFLDTETTGLEVKGGHRIVEIAMLEYNHREATGSEYHAYLNPEREISPNAYKKHGLDVDFLSDHPVFSELAEGMLDFARDAQVIIHNAPFDLGFINAEIERCNHRRAVALPMFDQLCEIVDSLTIARNKYGGRNDLDTLCTRLNIDNSERVLHGALVDAQLLAKVYMAMTSAQGKLELKVNNHSQLAASQLPQDLSFLTVVEASDSELSLHNKYMKKLGY